jgi:lipopolysaccharide export system permease protein
MIFLRSTLREFASVGIAVFIVLLAVTVTTQLIRLLGLAARGGIPADAVLTLMGFAALGYLGVLLSGAMYLSILLSMSRAYRDSEMIVWQSAGLSLTRWFKPVLLFAMPVVLISGLLSLYLTPWAIGKSEEFRHQMENRDDVSAVTPGVFRESKNAERVFFVEKVTSDLTKVANIFVHSIQSGRMGVMVASRGFVQTAESGDRYLVLTNGRRYEGTPGQADYRIVEFERYAVRIEQSESKSFFPSHKSRSTAQLINDPTPHNLGELVNRLGVPIAALLLALVAVPLSAVNPRTGRYYNVIIAVLVYMVYNNVGNFMQAMVAGKKVGFLVGVSAAHVAMALILLVLIGRQLRWFAFLRRR